MKLVVFDVDGVLLDVDKSSFEFLAERIGKEFDAVELAEDYDKETHRDYCGGGTGLEKFALLFADTKYDELKGICDNYVNEKLMLNSEMVFKKLREQEIQTAIISSNPSILLESLNEVVGADFVIGNELETEDETFTGQLAEALDSEALYEKLKELVKELGIGLNDVAIVASSKGRAVMMDVGTFIAFNTEEESVLQKAHYIIKDKDLINVLNYTK